MMGMHGILLQENKCPRSIPFGTVLTLAATGSEMNPSSVITNWETNEKYGWGSPYVYPQFSILRSSSYVYSSKKSNGLWHG